MKDKEIIELLTLDNSDTNDVVSKNKNGKRKKIAIITSSSIGGLLLVALFLFYGPWSGFRNLWITTAMTTMNHRYLATSLYSDETIQQVLAKNQIIEPSGISNPNLIKFTRYGDSTTYKNKYDEQILNHDKDALYKVIDIKGDKYNGYLVAIYDPSRISIATSKHLGKTGQLITTVAKDNDAIIAMNAGGFYDPDWNSNGALPHGTVIQNGKIVSDYDDASMGGGFIGFDKDNKLILGKMTKEQALKKGLRDAIEFGPFLIINGKSAFVKGNGGWGIAPRSAIGQRKDGIVLFLVINGRLATSIGADMSDLTEVMENYGAVNAANLDGGSSTELVINHKIINTPVAAGTNGLRTMATFWIVK